MKEREKSKTNNLHVFAKWQNDLIFISMYFFIFRSTQSLVELVPRLWPFMSHNIASVRQAALDTMLSLLQTDTATQWLTPILQDLLRHIYQRCLIEHKPEILEVVYKVGLFFMPSPCRVYPLALCPSIHPLICTLCTYMYM